MKEYDVAIIGAGIIGAFAALELAENGASVVLIEKRFPGAGSTGKSGAILRQHYSRRETIDMARYSLARYRNFSDRYGADIGFQQPGMIFGSPTESLDTLRKNIALQQSRGVTVREISRSAARELSRGLRIPDGVAIAWEEEAGYVDPNLTVRAVVTAASNMGAELTLGHAVVGIETDGSSQSKRLRFDNGSGAVASEVILAAGPWSRNLLARHSIDVPLQVLRPQQAWFELPSGQADTSRIVLDASVGVYWKPEGEGRIRSGFMAMDNDERVADPDNYDEGVSGGFVDSIRERLSQRVQNSSELISWGGAGALYTATPDYHPIIDQLEELDGVWLVSGFSGHGFKLAPAVAAQLGNFLARREDPKLFGRSLFARERFATRAESHGAYEYGILG